MNYALVNIMVAAAGIAVAVVRRQGRNAYTIAHNAAQTGKA